MKLSEVKDGQKFTIPNQKGIWHTETREVRKESIWYIEPGQTHRDMYNEEGGILWGATWDMEVELVNTPTEQARDEVAGTDAIVQDEIIRGQIEKEIHRLKTEGLNADQEDKTDWEEYIDTIAGARKIKELEDKLEGIKYGYTQLTPTETSIRFRNADGTYSEPIPVPREVYDYDAQNPNTSNNKLNYTSLEEILQDIQDARRLYNHDSADEELDEIIKKLQNSIKAGMYIQINGTI